ncbi:hypothetical protein LZ31DRAFT_561155 [Colletotrichum somersetense]|nr:hypothetical protein LZ31DRAFT_561155 [Colletotrichum somersetense]
MPCLPPITACMLVAAQPLLGEVPGGMHPSSVPYRAEVTAGAVLARLSEAAMAGKPQEGPLSWILLGSIRSLHKLGCNGRPSWS